MRIAAITLLLVLLIPVATANHGGNAAFTSSGGVWYLYITGSAISCSASLTPPSGPAISWGSPSSGAGTGTNTFNLAGKGVQANVAYTLGHSCSKVCPSGQYWDGTWGANSCKPACPEGNPYASQGYPQFICAGSAGGSQYASYACPTIGQKCYACGYGTYFDGNGQCTRYYEGDGICAAAVGEPSSSSDCQNICPMVCIDAGGNDDGGQCYPGSYVNNALIPCSNDPSKWCTAEGWCGPDSCLYASENGYGMYDSRDTFCGSTGQGSPSGGGGGPTCLSDGEYCGFGGECCDGICENEYCNSGYAIQ